MSDLNFELVCDENYGEDFNRTFDSPNSFTAKIVSDVSTEVTQEVTAGTGTFTGLFIAVLINMILSVEVRYYWKV